MKKIFVIKGEMYHEGHLYKDDDGERFMVCGVRKKKKVEG